MMHLKRSDRARAVAHLAVVTIVFALGAGVPAAALAASVTLHWTAPGDDGDTGTAAVYDVRYSTSPITNGNWNSVSQATGEPAPSGAGTAETFTVSGLASNTTYYFAVKTADEAGNWSGLSNVATVTTADTIPPAAIVDLSAGP